VVLAGHKVVAGGFHVRAGSPHAEVNALTAAGGRARGATLVVTLEPCNHTGRTGPCTEAILAAGITRVVIGAPDPNPHVAGGGAARLRAAGVEVVAGVMAAECAALNAGWAHWVATGRPFVTLKLATTLDGRIAARTGASQWITGPPARRRGHELRAESDAILVGAGTALADDPRLGVREIAALSDEAGPPLDPLRVLVDSRLSVPPAARLFARGDAGVVVATASPTAGGRAAAIKSTGATVWRLAGEDGRVDLAALIARLGSMTPRPVTRLLVEGGGEIAASLLRADLVDRVKLFMAPRFMGGDGLPAIAGLGVTHPDAAPRFVLDEAVRVGDDLELTLRPAGAAAP
jgi:diaminohydroxyphosphoribosylaminopyrimidine deaminase/5-amino-6-(5-phosphoribosylamino)uracil reductase